MNETGKPVAGFYKRRMVRGGPWVGVKLWFGPPADPVTGEPLDRSPRWQALVAGVESEPYEAWISCCGHPITEDEYRNLTSTADPFAKINLRNEPTIF